MKRHIPSNYVVRHLRNSLQASRCKDLEIEQPIVCRDFTAFHLHPTLAGMLSTALIRHQVVQPTFKGEWYAAVNVALLLLLDTRLDQCPRPHRRSDDDLGCRGAGGGPHYP